MQGSMDNSVVTIFASLRSLRLIYYFKAIKYYKGF